MATCDHQQMFDFDGLKGRLLSCSYAPKETDAGYREMIEALRSLFNRYSDQSQVCFPYTTYVYCAQLPNEPGQRTRIDRAG